MDKELKETAQDIFIDIDSLFDTRLPVVYFLDEEVATSIVEDGSYFTRKSDKFKYIDNNIFKAVYKERNKTLLTLATPTNIMGILKQYYSELMTQHKLDGTNKNITIYLNIYPYELSLEETDKLVIGIQAITSKEVVVKIVSMEKRDLTVKWVNDNLAVMVMYDGLEWLEYYTANFELINNPLLDVGLIVPAIVTNNSFNPEKIDDYEAFIVDTEKATEPLIKLKMLYAKDFSIAN